MSADRELSCPEESQLAEWLEGRVNPPVWDEIAEHLEQCLACQTKLEVLVPESDTVAAALQKKHPPKDPSMMPTETFPATDDTGTGDRARQPSAPSDELAAGSEFGQYRIVKKIGQGGMGSVYRAVHTKLQKTVALKVLPSHALSDPEAVDRFQREMRAVGSLDHPHIVGAHDAGDVNGIHYLVMEYLEGKDLASFVREDGRLSPRSACRLIRQAAGGLAHAHENGLIHRDIKPSNLLLTAGPGRRIVKVLDLGLARLNSQAEESVPDVLTSTGQIMGTVDYMAPEQAVNTRHADERSDIYSLGMTLCFLLTGRPPFPGETAMEKLLAHREAPRPDLSEFRKSVPDVVQQLFERMVAPDPAERFQSMGEVVEALDECQQRIKQEKETPGSSIQEERPNRDGTESTDVSAVASGITSNIPPEAVPPSDKTTQSGSGSLPQSNATTAISSPVRSRFPVAWSRRQVVTGGGVFALFALSVFLLLQMDLLSDQETDSSSESTVAFAPLTNDRSNVDNSSASVATGRSDSLNVAASSLPAHESLPRNETVESVAAESTPLRGLVPFPVRLDGVKRWQMETARPRSHVQCVAFSPKGDLIAIATDAGVIRIVDAETLELRSFCQGHTHRVIDLTWSPNGESLVSSGSDGTVRFWSSEGQAGPVIRKGDFVTNWRSLAWSPDGRFVAAARRDGMIRLWTPSGNAGPAWPGPSGNTICVAWKPGTSLLTICDIDGTIRTWDVEQDSEPAVLECRGIRCTWSPDGSTLALQTREGLNVWSKSDGTKALLKYGSGEKPCFAWSADSRRIVLAVHGQRPQIVSINDGQVQPLRQQAMLNGCGAWGGQRNRIVTYDRNHALAVWDEDGNLVKEQALLPYGGEKHPICWNSAGNQLVTAGDEHQVRVWSAQGVQKACLIGPADRHYVSSVAWQPNGDLISVAYPISGSSVFVWSAEGELSHTLDGSVSTAWSPSGDRMAGFSGSSVRLWTPEGEELDVLDTAPQTFSFHSRLSWSPDASQIAFSDNRSGIVSIWDLASGMRRDHELPNLPGDGHSVPIPLAAHWNPTSDWILVPYRGSSLFGLIRADGRTGPVVETLQSNIGAATWTVNGSGIAIGGKTGRVQLWSPSGAHRSDLEGRLQGHIVGMASSSQTALIAAGTDSRQLAVWNAETLSPLWSAVLLADGGSVTFSADGQIISATGADVDRDLVCLVESPDGSVTAMKPSEFEVRYGHSLRQSP